MNVKQIVKEYLEKNGFDGLYTPIECGCKLDDLMPCYLLGSSCSDCEPGYLQPGDEDYDYFIGPDKNHDLKKQPGLFNVNDAIPGEIEYGKKIDNPNES